MNYSSLNDKTLVELLALSRETREKMFNLRLQQASSQLEKPSQIRSLRRDVARIETRITQVRKEAS